MKLEVDVKYFKIPDKLADDGVAVGWFEDQRYDDNLSIAKVARWQEDGTKQGIPRRPFMTQAKFKYGKIWYNEILSMVQKAIDENKNIEKPLMIFGEKVKSDIQETILNGSYKKNAESTIRKKGFNKPLIDTGIMIASIQSRTLKELAENV